MGNIHWHQGLLTRAERSEFLGSPGATVWFTGLSGSGKSTIACALEKALVHSGVHCYRLDGDNLRCGLNRDLGFSEQDRSENVRRIAEVARLFADAGVVVLVCAISPRFRDRAAGRELHREGPTGPLPFVEVFVSAPIAVCESRDPKGLYARARAGELREFTGLTSPYEPPLDAELVLRTENSGVDECVEQCLAQLRQLGIPRRGQQRLTIVPGAAAGI